MKNGLKLMLLIMAFLISMCFFPWLLLLAFTADIPIKYAGLSGMFTFVGGTLLIGYLIETICKTIRK